MYLHYRHLTIWLLLYRASANIQGSCRTLFRSYSSSCCNWALLCLSLVFFFSYEAASWKWMSQSGNTVHRPGRYHKLVHPFIGDRFYFLFSFDIYWPGLWFRSLNSYAQEMHDKWATILCATSTLPRPSVSWTTNHPSRKCQLVIRRTGQPDPSAGIDWDFLVLIWV